MRQTDTQAWQHIVRAVNAVHNTYIIAYARQFLLRTQPKEHPQIFHYQFLIKRKKNTTFTSDEEQTMNNEAQFLNVRKLTGCVLFGHTEMASFKITTHTHTQKREKSNVLM